MTDGRPAWETDRYATDEELIRAAITDAFYDCRNEGGTMHSAHEWVTRYLHDRGYEIVRSSFDGSNR